MEVVFSGIQPTGYLHLGNYLGAICHWIDLQKKHSCLFCIADLHAITVQQIPSKLQRNTYNVAAALLSAGIDTNKHILFLQSSVPGHAQLAWILNCVAKLGWLNRMTQFKEKAGKDRASASVGLYTYPSLMAADILLYQATHVPVGEDQKQHLELARDIAQKFNKDYSINFFPIPEPMILGTINRVMSLRDGTQKMSKSDPSDYARLNIMDTNDIIALKIRKAKTDLELLPDNLNSLHSRPEATNLINIYAALAKVSKQEALTHYAGCSFSDLKQDLTDLVITVFTPLRSKMKQFLEDIEYLDSILRTGSERADTVACSVLSKVHNIVGFSPVNYKGLRNN